MRFELTTRSYNRARRDYLHWLISQGYFIDHGIPEELQEEAIVISAQGATNAKNAK